MDAVELIPCETELDLSFFTEDVTLYKALSASTEDHIFMCDLKRDVFYFPDGMVDEFNLPKNIIEHAASIWADRIHPDERQLFLDDLLLVSSGISSSHSLEYRVKNKHDKWIWVRCRASVKKDLNGDARLFAGFITNLGRKSKIDHLTGLLNKYEFENTVIADLGKPTGGVAILMIGLDNFKYINNLYGWEYGDSVIREIAHRMQQILPSSVRIYRLDGDVFGIYTPRSGPKELKNYFKLLQQAFLNQQVLQGHRYYCTLSGGISTLSDGCESFDTILKQAEYALDFAKTEGRNRVCVYNSTTMGARDRSLILMELLRGSVESNFSFFEIYFQPQVDAKTLKIIGAEALLRWHHDILGTISPVEFVPLLERTGLIHQVGKWVLRESAHTCALWRREDDPNFVISVNLSYLQLLDTEFIPYISETLGEASLPPEALHMELTESCIASGSVSLTEAFARIRDIGVYIEMDDFGTGYSSLEILKNKPADIVKIDRAFVKDITRSNFDATFIQFAVALCHSVDIRVCLEGVEQWVEYNLVKDMGIDIIQGFLFGKPVPRDVFEATYFQGQCLGLS